MNIDWLSASYEPLFSVEEKRLLSKHHLIIDPVLSTKKVRVYVNSSTHEVYLVYPGTQDLKDVVYDIHYIVGNESNTKRFHHHRQLEKQIRHKYGNHVKVLGHSLGGAIADRSIFSNRHTYNKLHGWNTTINPKQQEDHYIVGDPLNFFPSQHAKGKITWATFLLHPLAAHSLKLFRA